MPRSSPARHAEQAAGRYLDWLLRNPALPYRQVWANRALDLDVIVPSDDPSFFVQEMVAAVYTKDLYDRGDLDIDEHRRFERTERTKQGRLHRTKISRALKGDPLTITTLKQIIRAFGISGEHEQRLLNIWHGKEYAPVIEGDLVMPSTFPRYGYETVSINEDHYLGPDGLPDHHETQQAIRALRDGIEYFPHYFDAHEDEIDVRLLYGGTQSKITNYNEELSLVRYTFHEPLQLGEIKDFKYRLDFRYSKPPLTFYNRRIYGRYSNGWHLHVFFHEQRPPSQVWWTEWATADEDSPIKYEEVVEPDPDLSVHRHLLSVGRAVAGFRWVW